MCRMRVLIALTVPLFALGANRAGAEPITLSFAFVASGFGVGAPVDPVSGSFFITFDNSQNLAEQTRGITISNLSIDLDSSPGFAYGAVADVLILGSSLNGVQTLVPGTNDFLFGIRNASTQPRAAFGFSYSQASAVAVYRGAATLTAAPAPIPEPATFTLVGAGAALALLKRRRHRCGQLPATLT
jgi:hypothetical protein